MRRKTRTQFASAALIASALAGCSQADGDGAPTPPASSSQQPSGSEPASADLALLAPGTQPSFSTHDDYEQAGRLGERGGCVTFTLQTGEELLLYAPYGSSVAEQSPQLRLPSGLTYGLGDQVVLTGQVQDIWRAVGASAPEAWKRCVGGRGDHELMFVIGTA